MPGYLGVFGMALLSKTKDLSEKGKKESQESNPKPESVDMGICFACLFNMAEQTPAYHP